MKAYGYDKEGKYTGAWECQRDPVKSKRTGTDCYLIPASATTTAPPEFYPETQLARWDGEKWSIEELPPAPEPGPMPDPEPSDRDIINTLLGVHDNE